jgi:hypothetical protein
MATCSATGWFVLHFAGNVATSSETASDGASS